MRASSARVGATISSSRRSFSAKAAVIPSISCPMNGSPNSRSADSRTTTPMESERLVISRRADELGTYPSSSMATVTAALTSGPTRGLPLTTRETVAVETPARAATSLTVTPRAAALRFRFLLVNRSPRCEPR